MIKKDEIEHPESCLSKARDDERLFVLLARDPAAPVAIRAWITERLRLGKNTASDEQIREAFECATLMELERAEVDAARRQEQLPWASPPVSWWQDLSAIDSWEALARLLRTDRRASCSVATCARSSCPHKMGPAWSPATRPFGLDHAFTVSALVLDLDGVADLATLDKLEGYQHIVHATHADRLEDRYVRVVVALSRPVASVDWPRFWRAAVAMLGVCGVDETCRDAGRAYFLPSRPCDAYYYFAQQGGRAIDVDAVLATTAVATGQDKMRQVAP